MKIETVEGLFGELIHYQDGQKVGESWPGLLSHTYNHYDADGNKTGRSDIGLFAEYNHYDADNNYEGYTMRGVFGTHEHYNEDGHVGTTYRSFYGDTTIIDE